MAKYKGMNETTARKELARIFEDIKADLFGDDSNASDYARLLDDASGIYNDAIADGKSHSEAKAEADESFLDAFKSMLEDSFKAKLDDLSN